MLVNLRVMEIRMKRLADLREVVGHLGVTSAACLPT